MPDLHVIMTNHTDLNVMELIISQLPFIKSHYNTLLMESIPLGVNNWKALDYFAATIVTQVIDFSEVKDSLGISDVHFMALKNIYTGSLSNQEKVYLKYHAARELRAKHGETFARLNYFFNQYYFYYLNAEAIKMGIELLGIEAPSYLRVLGHRQQNRDAEIVANTQKILQDKNRNCLMVTGAEHGVDLMLALKDSPIKNSYTHLYCNKVIDKEQRSQLFKTEIETSGFKLGEQQSYLYLELFGKDRVCQERILCQRMLAMKSDAPNYHQHGRVSMVEGNSFTTMLSSLSKLSFFTSIDEHEYVADAVCNITNDDEKQKAETLQKSMNLGGFFRTGQGEEVFVIKNTNDPERLGLMRDSLYKI